MAQRKYPVMDVEDYLILNRSSKSARYEYLDGELRWTINTFEPGDTIILESLSVQFPIEEAYEGISLMYEP